MISLRFITLTCAIAYCAGMAGAVSFLLFGFAPGRYIAIAGVVCGSLAILTPVVGKLFGEVEDDLKGSKTVR